MYYILDYDKLVVIRGPFIESPDKLFETIKQLNPNICIVKVIRPD